MAYLYVQILNPCAHSALSNQIQLLQYYAIRFSLKFLFVDGLSDALPRGDLDKLLDLGVDVPADSG